MSPYIRIAPPPTVAHEKPICGQCRRCHPGRQFGGDTFCTKSKCTCHRWEKP